jgi:hypothetical protein
MPDRGKLAHRRVEGRVPAFPQIREALRHRGVGPHALTFDPAAEP